MKIIVLSIVFALFSGILFAQKPEKTRTDVVNGKKSGEFVKGKKAAYKLKMNYFNTYGELKNINIPDSLWRGSSEDGKLAPEKIGEKISEIVCKCIKPEELRLPREWEDRLDVSFILSEDFKIEKIIFGFSVGFSESDMEKCFWINLPVDRYYEMEKKIMKIKPIFDEKEKAKIREMDFEHGAFYSVTIFYENVCRFWKIEVKNEAEEELLKLIRGE